MSGDQELAIDQVRSAVAALSDQQQREAAAATFFADHALPVVEGNLCTFATRAAADSVYLRHRVNLWPDELELALIPGTDVWFLTIELEWGARVEYQFEIVRNRERWRFNDPYNPDWLGARWATPRCATGPVTRYPTGPPSVRIRTQASSSSGKCTV